MSLDSSGTEGPARWGEAVRTERQRQRRYQRRDRLQNAIERGNELLAEGDYDTLAGLLADVVLPLLDELDERQPWSEYHREFTQDDSEWYWASLKRFLDEPQRFQEAVARDDAGGVGGLTARSRGEQLSSDRARRVIRETLESLESVTAYHDVTTGEVVRRADTTGFSQKIGEHHQRWDMDFGNEIEGITRRLGALKHIYTGGTGGGKSVGASAQMEDYYRASIGDGRDFKCIDLAGLSSENIAAYDIPQQDSGLRRAREEHGLAGGWDEIDDYEPRVEYFVPLSPDLEDFNLPYDTESGEFIPGPFTIPASDLSEGLLVAVISARVSSSEERTIRKAYREVDNRVDDWSLGDLKRAIKGRQELSDKDREAAVSIVSTLQHEGFIRTAADEHTVDWDGLFRSTDTISVFNHVAVEEAMSKLLIVASLLEQIYKRRIRTAGQGYPDLVTWLRELWELAPHREHRRKSEDIEQNLQEHIISVLTKMQRKPRDISQHLIADTQDYKDIEKAVRTRFNRYCLFGGTDEEIKEVFSASGQNGWKGFKGTLSGEPGYCGIIGGCEPAISSPRKYGASPVHLTPPSWHHYDKNQPASGWIRRVEYREHEELRALNGAWDIEPPDESVSAPSTNSDEGSADDEGTDSEGKAEAIPEPSPEDLMSPIEKAKLQARQLRSLTTLSYEKIADRIPNNPDTGDPYDRSTVRDWAKDVDKGEGELQLDL